MLIYLLRHGLTQDNQEKRYQGRRDVPLCPQGLAQLCRADFAPKRSLLLPCSAPGRRRKCFSPMRNWLWQMG